MPSPLRFPSFHLRVPTSLRFAFLPSRSSSLRRTFTTSSPTSTVPTLSPEAIHTYHTHGYLTVHQLIQPYELENAQDIFDRFMNKSLPVDGNDYGIHTPGLVNVTAYNLYHSFQTLGFFKELEYRCSLIAAQLYPSSPADSLQLDYVQLLRKLPNHPTAVFPPHQDFTYWPKSLSNAFDMRTATVSVALNKADPSNGCLWVLPFSHVSKQEYRSDKGRDTLPSSRTQGGGVIQQHLNDEDYQKRVYLPLEAGDITIHNEYILHGSEGNRNPTATRDTAIFAYRAPSMIAFERSIGFRHSYNDKDEVLRRIRETWYP